MKRYIISLFVFFVGILFVLSSANAEVILGCYQKKHGQLRIVNNHSECLDSEKPITLTGINNQNPSPDDITIIEGTWPLTVEAVTVNSDNMPNSVLFSSNGQGTLFVEEQKNGVFWGNVSIIHEVNGEDYIEDYIIVGAIVSDKITIVAEDDAVIHATLCGNTLAGVIADHNHDETFSVIRFTGTRQEGE